METKLRLGRIDYVNADPFFCEHGAPGALEVLPAKPSSLNADLVAGRLDLSWISSIELARHARDLLLCPRFCIAAPGPVLSVVLASPVPLEELAGSTVWLTRFSSTSICLLRVLLDGLGLEVNYRTYDHRGPLPDAPTLLIGDEALRHGSRLRDERHVYDLAELWREQTGLPMVFAVLAMRRDLLGNPERLEQVELALDWMGANLQRFRTSPVTSRAFQERRAGLSPLEYERYFRGFCFEWDRRTQRGYEHFRERASRIDPGVSPRTPDLYDPVRRTLRQGSSPSAHRR